MSDDKQGQQETLRPYEPPHLKQWGSVSDITKQGQTNPGGDANFGSVHPTGQE